MEGTKMKCPKCQFENPEGSKFCGGCRQKFDLTCPECGANNPAENKFCNECGSDLKPVKEVSDQITEKISPPVSPSKETIGIDTPSTTGERKHVTVLFSDLTGYTTMSEKLDPEDVKEITSRIFGEISKIVANYDGFIEKYAGDAVMAIFGVPQAHEDDPIRAIKAAREIHQLVDAISPEVEKKIGQSISMHTGINTGLVVTGEVDMERGTHGIAGDTINLASRLSNLANPGEIVVDVDTCHQVEGQFACEYMKTTTVKGKAAPIHVHKVLSQRDKPVTIHRLSGLRADLVGRKVELAELSEAVDNLHAGKGRIFSICGAAGTGKSRLVEEFKATLDFEQIQWIEGHAYAYSQNIPYFPLIDLFNRILHIEENDPPEKVREKVERGIENLVGKQEEIVPYVGGLYSLSYPEVEEVSPEFWKSRLQSATKAILSALANKAPSIYFIEDLHWADPSFVELLRQACLEIREPAIVLCVYRPTFNLFTGHQLSGVGKYYHEIQLQDLSRSEAQDMLESLLKTSNIPSDLKRLVQSKAEGNPFYLEELVNSLIESETLILDNGHWKITKSISEADVSSSIHGLISGRLDRLDKETKRILQEASVIGRAFLYEILLKITELKDFIDGGLSTLERLDLIRTRALQPDLEYMFKHPLTQEVVYNGVLKKERQEIHEQIALVIEGVFQDRLPEFYETLAFHFKQGRSILKAVDYLIRSGEKSLARYAVEESHQYFKEAFDLLSHKPQRTKREDALLIELLIKWSSVRYYMGDLGKYVALLSVHRDLAESLGDKAKLGMFYAWYGWSLWFRAKFKDSYEYLRKALEVGEQIEDQKVIGYACTWLSFTCTDLGALEEAILCGERAQEISKHIPSDQYLFFKPLAGIGYACVVKGNWKTALEAGKAILDYGQRHSNIRSMAMGHFVMGFSFVEAGDFPSAIEAYKKAIRTAQDPMYSQFSRWGLGIAYAQIGQFKEAEEALQEVASYCRDFGCEYFGTPTHAMLGLVSIAKGRMGQGLKMIEETLRACHENQWRTWYVALEHALGQVYLQIVDKSATVSLSTMTKNVGFILKNVPSAAKKAAEHFNKAIEVAKEIGAKGIEGKAYLDLGHLHQAKGRSDQARDCFSTAVRIFEECESEVYMKQAYEALETFQ
jgi:class 3 adenylate cyclase/tetratricopeptide (TPR) repeat protein